MRIWYMAAISLGLVLPVSHSFAQTPPKIDFAVHPFPQMSVHVSAKGSATYFPDRLVVNLRTLRLKDVSRHGNATIESVGMETYALDEKELGRAARVLLHKELSKDGELRFENVELVVSMDAPIEDFIFYLAVYMPSGEFWISQKVEMPGLARARNPQR